MNYITLKYRIKDSTTKKHLNRMAEVTNFVWNYCNEVSHRSITYNNKYLSWQDLQSLCKGTSAELKMPAQSINAICKVYAVRRKQFRRIKLKWRSHKRSLGWIPFTGQIIRKIADDKIKFNGKIYRFWNSRFLPEQIRHGSFNRDVRGRWYISCIIEDTFCSAKYITSKILGIDLGIKTTASYSDGEVYVGEKPYIRFENQLSNAQKANKKRLVKTIHAKITNIRKDSLHKETTRIIRNYDKIFIGDVSSVKLLQTDIAKHVTDVGWGFYRFFLKYKAIRLGKEVIDVRENFSSVTCSSCGQKTGPRGPSGLEVREWICSACNTSHNRDINSAINILRFGCESLKGSITDMGKTKKRINNPFLKQPILSVIRAPKLPDSFIITADTSYVLTEVPLARAFNSHMV